MKINQIIKNHYKDLTFSEKKIADNVLENNIDPIIHSITEAANKSKVSTSLINKFCIKIGVSGWKTLRGLTFIELRREKIWEEDLLSNNFNLIMNTFTKRNKIMNIFIKRLYDKMYSADKVIIFANGTTKRIAELMAYKWNKLGGNIIIYDYTESFVSIDSKTVVLFLTISGLNQKINYYEKQTNIKNRFLITFGKVNNFSGSSLEFDIYKHFNKIEKSFPVETDVFFHFLLNKFIYLRLNDSAIIKHKIKNIKLKDV